MHIYINNDPLTVRRIFIISSTYEYRISYYQSSILITFRLYPGFVRNTSRCARIELDF